MGNKKRLVKKQRPNISPESRARTSIRILETERAVIGYGITENELDSVSLFSSLITICFSIISFLLTTALSFIVSLLAQDHPTIAIQLLAKLGAPILAVLAIAVFIIALLIIRKRKSIRDRIIKQTRMVREYDK